MDLLADPYFQGFILGRTLWCLVTGTVFTVLIALVALLVRRATGSTIPVNLLLVRTMVWTMVVTVLYAVLGTLAVS